MKKVSGCRQVGDTGKPGDNGKSERAGETVQICREGNDGANEAKMTKY